MNYERTMNARCVVKLFRGFFSINEYIFIFINTNCLSSNHSFLKFYQKWGRVNFSTFRALQVLFSLFSKLLENVQCFFIGYKLWILIPESQRSLTSRKHIFFNIISSILKNSPKYPLKLAQENTDNLVYISLISRLNRYVGLLFLCCKTQNHVL